MITQIVVGLTFSLVVGGITLLGSSRFEEQKRRAFRVRASRPLRAVRRSGDISWIYERAA